MEASEHTAAVFFVGNRLMLDDGVGPAAYDEILAGYDIPENVTLVDVGCMSLDMLPYVERCDVILTVDAVDGTGDAPGTVYRFEPDAMARHSGPEASLHDLKLVDLFDAASLMGYEAEGFCLGMQVGNPSPEQFVVGLTPECAAALPARVQTSSAERHRLGFPCHNNYTGLPMSPPTGVRRRLSAMEGERVLPPLASGGAQIADDAVGAAGVAGAAEFAAEVHPLRVDEQPLGPGVHLQQDVLHLLRRVGRRPGQLQPVRDAEHVGVHRDALGVFEGLAHHAVRRLAAHAGQLLQCVHVGWDLAAEVGHHHLGQRHEVFSFRTEEAERADDFRHLVGRGRR